jgi:hypothetical protein
VPGGGVTITIGFVLLGFGWYFLCPQGSGEPQVSISSLVESPVEQRPSAQDIQDAVGKGLVEVVPSIGADELPSVGSRLDAVGEALSEVVPSTGLCPQGSGEPQVLISSLVESSVEQRPSVQDIQDAVGKGLVEVVPSTGADELPAVDLLLDTAGKGLAEVVPTVCAGCVVVIGLVLLVFYVLRDRRLP